ncbi:MAG: hybrid sensor histidine kinase/response regulator [Bacteroidetes bacterium]|nr:hybrid sensor histidine kinase/response regulator [Bacteroidota bacterium]
MENKMNHNPLGPSILIVDDNPQNLQVLGRLLQEKNYDIEFATNGIAALDWLSSKQFDLVLLDINMPEMDGFEVCRRIRSDEKFSKLPVVFLSADNDRESILKGFELGGQDYVTKPFDSRELIVRVKTHISLKDSLEKLEDINQALEAKVLERTQQLRVANENLEAMNLKLLELDNAKSEFLNLISHEIRTPLNGIILPLEMLKDPLTPEESKELVDILDSSVKRLEQFSMNALLITRLKTRPYDIDKTKLNIGSIIDSVIIEENNSISSKGISVVHKKGAVACNIEGETDLVKKCIQNILNNAVMFSPSGSIVEIATVIEGNKVKITISDNGTGIPEEVLNMGFEPFSRGKDYHDKSTGVGIPLAKMIMKAHGGTIELKNRKDEGASVILQFILS